MKTKLIAFCVSSVLIGTGIVFNMNQDVSVPTVEKFMEDTSLSVSKHEAIVSEHENVGKDEKTGAGDTMKKPESKEEKQKEKVTGKSEFKTTSVSSEGKRQNSKKESSTKSSSGSDQKSSTSNSSNTSDKSKKDVVSQPIEKPTESMDTNFYYATYSSQAEAEVGGMYYLDEVMYIGDIEITNYSVQPVYRNDHSIAYYGLNLWSNGSLIQ